MAETLVFDLDVDDDAIPLGTRPSANIRVGGKVYSVKCPKDAVWAELVAYNRSGAEIGDRMFALLRFIDAVMGSSQAAELERRYRDDSDELNMSHLLLTRDRVEEHFDTWLSERFTAIGLAMRGEDDDDVPDPPKTAPKKKPDPRKKTTRAS